MYIPHITHHMYTHTHIHITYMHTHIHISIHCIHIYIYPYIHTRSYEYISIHIPTKVSRCIRNHTCIHTHKHIIHIPIHIKVFSTHTQSQMHAHTQTHNTHTHTYTHTYTGILDAYAITGLENAVSIEEKRSDDVNMARVSSVQLYISVDLYGILSIVRAVANLNVTAACPSAPLAPKIGEYRLGEHRVTFTGKLANKRSRPGGDTHAGHTDPGLEFVDSGSESGTDADNGNVHVDLGHSRLSVTELCEKHIAVELAVTRLEEGASTLAAVGKRGDARSVVKQMSEGDVANAIETVAKWEEREAKVCVCVCVRVCVCV
jgi:hypothetical protein